MPGRIVEQHRRIVGRFPPRVLHPRMRQFLAGLVQPPGEAIGGEAGRNVEQHRIARRGDAGRQRIGREHRGHAAEGCDALHRRIRAVDEAQHAGVGGALRIRGEARDVMRALDDHRTGAAGARHGDGGVERAQRQPRSRQPLSVPRLRGGARVDDHRVAVAAHRSLFDFAEVAGQQREAMGRVTEQVAIDQDRSDVCGNVAAHAECLHQGTGEGGERGSVVTGGSGGHDVGQDVEGRADERSRRFYAGGGSKLRSGRFRPNSPTP